MFLGKTTQRNKQNQLLQKVNDFINPKWHLGMGQTFFWKTTKTELTLAAIFPIWKTTLQNVFSFQKRTIQK